METPFSSPASVFSLLSSLLTSLFVFFSPPLSLPFLAYSYLLWSHATKNYTASPSYMDTSTGTRGAHEDSLHSFKHPLRGTICALGIWNCKCYSCYWLPTVARWVILRTRGSVCDVHVMMWVTIEVLYGSDMFNMYVFLYLYISVCSQFCSRRRGSCFNNTCICIEGYYGRDCTLAKGNTAPVIALVTLGTVIVADVDVIVLWCC